MQVDEDFNIRFVKLVEKHKCLYDKKVPEYRNKDFQEKSWLEIAAETSESVPHCKERWRNLRACLSRYIKQQNSSDPQHKSYYLTDHMQFVLPFLKSARQSTISSSNNCNNNNNNNNFNYGLKSEINLHERHTDPEETDDGYKDGGGGGGSGGVGVGGDRQNFTNFSTATTTPSSTKHSHHHHHHHQHMIPTTMNCIPDVSVDIEQSDDRLPPPPPEPEIMFMTSSSTDRLQTERKRIKIEHHYADENSDMDFFKSIIPDISNMNALQKRKFKIGVLELIDDIFEKYPEKKSLSNSHPPPTSSSSTCMTEIPNGYWKKSS